MGDTTNLAQLPPPQAQLPPQLEQNVVLNTQETNQEQKPNCF